MHGAKLLAALDFLRREKRMVNVIVTFVLASLVVRCTICPDGCGGRANARGGESA